EPDVRDALELEYDVDLLARFAQFGEAGRLALRVGQRRVPAPAAPATGQLELRAHANQVGEHLAVERLDHRAVRDAQGERLAGRTVAVAALPTLAVAGLDVRAELEVQERVDARIDDERHAAAVAPVAAVRPTERLELLPVDRHAAV